MTSRSHLESNGFYKASKRIGQRDEKTLAIPVTGEFIEHIMQKEFPNTSASIDKWKEEVRSIDMKTLEKPHLDTKNEVHYQNFVESNLNDATEKLKHSMPRTFTFMDINFSLDIMTLQQCKISKLLSPYEKLNKMLTILMNKKSSDAMQNTLKDIVQQDLPKSWEKHGNLILLPSGCFRHRLWTEFVPSLWEEVATALGGKRLARKSAVLSDGYRTPQVELLCGLDGWVLHTDNGIRYSYDVTKCMFSSGNITEKLRVASFNCLGETVVDLYAGIGYFTLPYLIHAKAAHVHACEWNPNAAEALKRNLQLNGAQNKCSLHVGDNRKLCLKNVADRVNLGLIPSSKEGWPVACQVLKPDTGGILHIHANIDSLKHQKYHSSNIHELSLNERHTCNIQKESNKQANETGTESTIESYNEFKSDYNDTQGTAELSKLKEKKIVNNSALLDMGIKVLTSNTEDNCKTNVQAHEISFHSINSAEKTMTLYDGVDDIDKPDDKCVVHESDDIKPKKDKVNTDSYTILLQADVETRKFNKKAKVKKAWESWVNNTTERINELLEEIHDKQWKVTVLHIEHVKSYAPHVDHIVLDLECRPLQNK